MEINERIKVLRKEILHLTQQEFADGLNISRSNMGNIEVGRIAVTDRVISDICEKYLINEEWLRTGNGEINQPLTREETIAKFTAELIKEEPDSFKKKLVEVLSKLDESQWEVLEDIANMLTKKD